MSALVVLPILVPLGTAIACLLARRRRGLQRGMSVAGAALLLAVAAALLHQVSSEGIQVMRVGGWPAPFGITLVADLLAAIMVLLTGITGLAVAVYALGSIDERREAHGFHTLYHVLLMGVGGAFLTGDLFNLYVWLRGHADGVVRAPRARWRARTARRSGQVRDAQPALLGRLPGRGGGALRDRRHPEHGGPGARHLPRHRPEPRAGPVGPVPRGVRHQGGAVPLLLLAAGLVPHPAGRGLGGLRGAPDQGRRLRPHPRFHPDLRRRHRLHPRAHPPGRGPHDGDRSARGGGADGIPADPVLPHRQPDRVHGHGPRAADAAWRLRRLRLLPRSTTSS